MAENDSETFNGFLNYEPELVDGAGLSKPGLVIRNKIN